MGRTVGRCIAVILACAGLSGLSGCGTYNTLVDRQEAIRERWSQVENVLQRRYELIPNLVSTVKGYAAHEQQLLERITQLRSQWGGARSVDDKVRAAQEIEGALGRLMVIVEQYPDLKANQNFLALQDELAGTENRIAVERRRYNEAVADYNVAVRRFPGNLIAKVTGFTASDAYFKAGADAQQAPKVQF